MIDFLCKLWPYLAGGLIGWLAAGWFARRLKHAEPPIEVEKIVEKVVERPTDNPKHLALISKLETENKEIASLKTKLSGYESATPKTIDNPIHLRRIADLEAQLIKSESFTSSKPQTAFTETVKSVDNPEHIKRIADLEAQLKEAQNASNNTPQAALTSTTQTVDNPVHLKRIGGTRSSTK